jgi:hypothetical protein
LCERLNISDLEELTWLLGLKVEQGHPKWTITLSQKAYIETILKCFCLQDAKTIPIPMNTGSILSRTNHHLWVMRQMRWEMFLTRQV